MWIILAGLIAGAVFISNYVVHKWSDNTSGVNYTHVQQSEVVTNILEYTSLAIDLIDTKSYKNTYLNNAEILGMTKNINIKLAGNYRASSVSYGRGQYLVVSWDSLNNKKINTAIITSEVANKISHKISLAGGSNIFVVNTNGSCNNMTVVNNYSGSFMKKKTAYESLLKNLCNTSLPSGYKIGLYNLIIQVH
jgi:hypothetical protein